MPVQCAPAASVTLDPGPQTARPEGAPNVDVDARSDRYVSQGTHLDILFGVCLEDEGIGPGLIRHRAEVVVFSSVIFQNSMPPACCPTSAEPTRS